MEERLLLIIKNYIYDHLFEPSVKWSKIYFDERSYSRWAANELLEELYVEANKLPEYITGVEHRTFIDICLSFIGKMEHCLEIKEDKRYEIAIQTAKGILFYYMEEDKK